MKLPLRAWKKTWNSLGFVVREQKSPRRRRPSGKKFQSEQLEPRVMLDGDDLEFGPGQDVGPFLPSEDIELVSPVWPPEMEGSEYTTWPEPYQDAGGEWVFPQPFFDPSIIVVADLPPDDGSGECFDGPSLEQGSLEDNGPAGPVAPDDGIGNENPIAGGSGNPSPQPQVYNPSGSDIAVGSFTSDGHSLIVGYTISGPAVNSFNITFYASQSTAVVSSNAPMLKSYTLSGDDLNAGNHTKTFSGITGFTDVESDYYLVVKVDADDSNDESSETNNETGFAGGVFEADGIVYVQGQTTTAIESVTISQSTNLTVQFGTLYSFSPLASYSGIHIRLHDGNDTVNSSSSVTKNTWAFGGAGNDSLYAGGGSDKLYGGVGNDTYYFGTGNLQHDSVTEASMAGADVLNFATFGSSVSIDLMQTTEQQVSGNLYLTVYCTDEDGYSEAIANVTGSNYNDTISGNLRANSIYGGNGNDIIHGGDGNDFLDDGAGDDTAYGDAGNDSFAQNTTGSDTYYGGNDADYFYGGYSAETFYGGSGNDVYTFPYFSTGLNTIYENEFADRDLLNFASFGSGTQGISLNLGTTAPQSMGNMTLQLMDASGIEDVIGTTFADTITANARSNLLQGGLGADTYRFVPVTVGDQGSDEISETSSSGGVYDTLNFANFADAVDVDLSSSVSRQINSIGSNNLWLKLTNASSVRSVVGSNYADTIVGNSGDNFLFGGSGNDTLRGGSGNDLLDGGANNDYCYGEAGNDTFESPGPNGADNDHLYGGAGNDTFYVGRGDDELRGEENDDTYVFTSGADGSKSIIELAGAGADKLDFSTLVFNMSIDLGSTSPQFNAMSGVCITLSTTNGTSDGIENVLAGSGSDAITGNSRSNVLQGNMGDDTYKFVGGGSLATDTIVETNNVAGGADTLDFSALSATVTANLTLTSQQTVVSGGVLNLTLGSSAAWIENLTGGSGNDTLTGNTLANTLSGGVGNDTLTGNAGDDVLIGDSEFAAGGDDTLSGGDGNDTYKFVHTTSTGDDSVADSGGTDTLDFSTQYHIVTVDLTLTTQQPATASLNLTLGTAAAVLENVIGGTADDSLTGNALGNVLNGGEGNDLIVGGPGDDTLAGGAGGDVYFYTGSQSLGSDAIQETNDGQSNVFEALTLSGVGHLTYATVGPQVVSQNILTVSLSGSGLWQNNAPTVSEDPYASVNEDAVNASAINLASVFHDLETSESEITYQILDNSNPSIVPTASLNVVNGSLVATPAENKYGYTYVTVRATDSQSVSVDADILLVVTPADDAPQFVGVSNQISVTRNSTNIDTPYLLDLWSYFTDVEYASYLEYSFVGNSTPREISTASIEDGILRLDFSRMPGTSSIVIRASDDSNHAATDLTITITVDVPLPVIVSDVWGPLEGYADGLVQFRRTSDSSQALTLPYTLSNGASGTVTFEAGERFSAVVSIPKLQPDENHTHDEIHGSLDGNQDFFSTVSWDQDALVSSVPTHVSDTYEGGPDGAFRFYRVGPINYPVEHVYWVFLAGEQAELKSGIDIDNIFNVVANYGGLIFSEGQYSATFPIHAIDDDAVEGIEGARLRFGLDERDSGYLLDMYVIDNDVAPPGSVSVNLVIDGLTEAQEESPGTFLAINDDFEEGERGPDTANVGTHHDIAIERLFADNEPDRGRKHKPTAPFGNEEVHYGSLDVDADGDAPVTGSLHWTIPDGIKVYWLRANRWIPVSDVDEYDSGVTEQIAYEVIDSDLSGPATVSAEFDAGSVSARDEDAVLITPFEADIIAHRTGEHKGDAVDAAIEDIGGDAFVVLTNNDFDAPENTGHPDFENRSADTENDDDLVELTLCRISSASLDGDVSLAVSTIGAVRLFKNDGSLLYEYRDESDDRYDPATNDPDVLSAALSSDSYLAGVSGGDVTLWLESLVPGTIQLTWTVSIDGLVPDSDTIAFRSAQIENEAHSRLLAGASTAVDQFGIPESAKFRFDTVGLGSATTDIYLSSSTGGGRQAATFGGYAGDLDSFDIYYAKRLARVPRVAESPPAFDPDTDPVIEAEITTSHDAFTRRLAGSNRPFYYYAYKYNAFDPTSELPETVIDIPTEMSETMPGGPELVSNADAFWEQTPLSAGTVFPGDTASAGAARAMMAYFQSLYGGKGQFFLRAFLETRTHPASGGAGQLLKNRIVFQEFGLFRSTFGNDYYFNEATNYNAKSGVEIVIRNALSPAKAAEALHQALIACATDNTVFGDGQLSFQIELKGRLLSKINDPNGDGSQAISEYRSYLQQQYASASATAAWLAESFYRSIAFINVGADFVISAHDLANGDLTGLVGAIPLVGRSLGQAIGNGRWSFRMFGESISNAASKALCKLLGGPGCFVAGTPVWTEDGLKLIEDVQAGDRVWAVDPSTGQWNLQEVLAPVSTPYSGQFVEFTVGGTQLTTTEEHPVWVVAGEGLSLRPPAADLPANEQGFTFGGRWVPAFALQVGDLVLLQSGETSAITSLHVFNDTRAVYNLAVNGPHTFAVGNAGVVVHNTPACSPEIFALIRTRWKEMYSATLEGTIWRINGRRVTWGSKAFAGNGFMDVIIKETGESVRVAFKPGGFPDFMPFLHPNPQINRVTIVLTGVRSKDRELADFAANLATRPPGYVWHHSEELGEMLLVDEAVHDAVKHTGGFAIFKAMMDKWDSAMELVTPTVQIVDMSL